MRNRVAIGMAGGLALTLAACGGGEAEEIDREGMAAEIKADLKAEMAAEEAADAKAEEDTAPAAKTEDAKPAPTATPTKQAAASGRQGKWRDIQCVVDTSETMYKGPCQFLAEAGGSFTIGLKDMSPMVGEVTDINVTVTGPGVAQVSGLTTFGNNSRWGEATRSPDDKACWDGADFGICAY